MTIWFETNIPDRVAVAAGDRLVLVDKDGRRINWPYMETREEAEAVLRAFPEWEAGPICPGCGCQLDDDEYELCDDCDREQFEEERDAD